MSNPAPITKGRAFQANAESLLQGYVAESVSLRGLQTNRVTEALQEIPVGPKSCRMQVYTDMIIFSVGEMTITIDKATAQVDAF